MVFYTFWSAARKSEQKSLDMIKVKSISKELDDIDIKFSFGSVYGFVKTKVKRWPNENNETIGFFMFYYKFIFVTCSVSTS